MFPVVVKRTEHLVTLPYWYMYSVDSISVTPTGYPDPCFKLRTFAPIVSAHPYCGRLHAQIHMARHASSARAKC